MTEHMKWAVQALALPAARQVELFPEFVNVADELVLALEDAIETKHEDRSIEGVALAKLRELDDLILRHSRNGDDFLWSTDGVFEHPVWDEIRRLAGNFASEMGWPIESPGPNGDIYIVVTPEEK